MEMINKLRNISFISFAMRYDVILFQYDNVLFGAKSKEERKIIFERNAYIIKPLK